MPITADGKVIFVHVPKCAGSSVEERLGVHPQNALKNVLREDLLCGLYDGARMLSLQHLKAHEMRTRLGEEKWNGARIRFAFVRNPWDRLVSEWTWRLDHKLSVCGAQTFSEFARAVAGGARPPPADHFDSQASFLLDPNDAEGETLLVDVVGRFETLADDWRDKVVPSVWPDALARATLPLEQTSSRRGKDYREMYDAETVEVVRKMYEQDVTMFGYRF